jgi:hypothetical protein
VKAAEASGDLEQLPRVDVGRMPRIDALQSAEGELAGGVHPRLDEPSLGIDLHHLVDQEGLLPVAEAVQETAHLRGVEGTGYLSGHVGCISPVPRLGEGRRGRARLLRETAGGRR